MTSPNSEKRGPGPRGRALFLQYWVPVLAYIGLIFSLSSIHGNRIPSLFPYMDKIEHLMEYSLFGLLLGRAIRFTFTRGSAFLITIATVAIGAGVGCLDEIYQGFVPGRQSDPLDWLTDLAAITAAVVLTQVVHLGPLRGRGRKDRDAGR
ncbi:MAG TPA: VanZ family protein [Candidatus Eisenbacteria bacterium]|nr:VanZ family protein [Candidatus Eisenbacteria bacterium]